MLSLKNLQYGYPGKAFSIAEMELHRNELTLILGKNGVGKTTLLKTLLGILPPISGNIYIDKNILSTYTLQQRTQKMAYVASRNTPINHITVLQLIHLGQNPIDTKTLDAIVDIVKIKHLLHKRLDAISDGEMQKAYIARALAQNTEYIVLDEPASHLDINARLDVFMQLQKLSKQGKGIVSTTHDLELALRIADKIYLLIDSNTQIAGTPEDLVLSGAISRHFNAPEIAFNINNGTFDFCFDNQQSITIFGEGSTHFWVKSALTRKGFRCVDVNEPNTAEVRIQEQDIFYKNEKVTSVEVLLSKVNA